MEDDGEIVFGGVGVISVIEIKGKCWFVELFVW